MRNQASYNKLRQSAKEDACEQFFELYPDSSVVKIHEILKELNPTVEWNDDGSGEYSIWEVWKGRFEKLLATK